MGDPKEAAHLALFLASDLARYISGSAITVDVFPNPPFKGFINLS
ncbi:SDR family oxidoreductase [Paenibacillus planticolens]|uniref:SDR family oxidoreductase n=1 Tax=Paenibacillus planticolens TaxID=2654976 RepID=A0ABX2A175_9BACL|nr:SDR family oxidoreductase [Paenibacillus planticolens]